VALGTIACRTKSGAEMSLGAADTSVRATSIAADQWGTKTTQQLSGEIVSCCTIRIYS